MNSEPNWSDAAQQMKDTFTASLQQLMGAFGTAGLPQPGGPSGKAGAPPEAASTATPEMPAPLDFDAEKLQQVQRRFMSEAAALWNASLQPAPAATPVDDRRFKSQAWSANPMARFTADSYLLTSRALLGLTDAVQTEPKLKARLRFAVEQWMAATAPSNYLAVNAEAQQKAIESRGQSIAQGMQNLLHDLRQGHVSMTDESRFEVGKNVATTEGAVVFENDLFQLIEYRALTDEVFEKPLLLVPPCINKFYILDLQPANSFIRYAVSQGHRTFVVSWRNPDESMAGHTWDDYVEHGAIKAIDVVRRITQAKTINALGFCVGGTILGTALSVLAARAEKPVASVTLLTSFLDFSDTGILDIFIDETSVQYREAEMGQGGLLKGKDLASTFSFLRPNELVWNYVVGNYLKGETPPPFDLLYWNSDATNLPGPFYAWYLRNTYFENNLITPGKCTVCGQKIDLRLLDMPVYIYGSREDHIVPVDGAYASTQLLPGAKRFVMGASGHIAGVINPPASNKRSYWTNEHLPANTFPAARAEWQDTATEHPGSWWPDWSAWLAGQAGKLVAAPAGYGGGPFKAIEPAPGRYVKTRA